MSDFSSRLLKWYRVKGRHDLPWQKNPTPYRVWVSEIMLQQTQVKTVIPYYQQFMRQYPNVKRLANARLDDVLHLWSGLGYYARARNLHKAAKHIMDSHHGRFPADLAVVMALPGIGRSTAGAILSLSKGQRHPILDGNVKRVMTRHQGINGWTGEKKVEETLWQLADAFTPNQHVSDYTQAIMDLGATLCTRSKPACEFCPVKKDCYAYQHNQQSQLPTSRPRKTLPVRQAIFTIIKNSHGDILLKRRPPSGIWGGLWSLPECPLGADITKWIEQNFGSKVTSVHEKPTLRHTFSHFHLDIQPVQVEVLSNSSGIKDSGEIYWYKPDDKLNRGIAAPVAQLLQEL